MSNIASAFDRIYTSQRREFFRRMTVYFAFGGFLVHLLLVFLGRNLQDPTPLVQAVGLNYLSALYTPFSFVLFYEVLLLILSIPESSTRSLGRQYEILSLIVIRNVFKDVAQFETVQSLQDELSEFTAVLLDVGSSLVML